MATYTELYDIYGQATLDPLKKKIITAAVIKANVITKLSTPTAAQKQWAISTLAAPENALKSLLNFILAEYNTATLATISGATDASVQTAVNNAVDTLFGV